MHFSKQKVEAGPGGTRHNPQEAEAGGSGILDQPEWQSKTLSRKKKLINKWKERGEENKGDEEMAWMKGEEKEGKPGLP